MLDSGASDHNINDENLFFDYVNLESPIKIAVAKCGEYIHATKQGKVKLWSRNQYQITLENVLFCQEVPQNLLSIRKMQDAGFSIEFNSEGVIVRNKSHVIIQGKCKNNVPIICFKSYKSLYAASAAKCNSYQLWHERLGHISKSKFMEIKSKEMFCDSQLLDNMRPNEELCEACINGKQSRLSFGKFKDKEHVRRPLFVIHSDVCGPITPPTIDEKNYYVIFVDEFTHYCVTYLITFKSEVFSVFKDFVAKSEALFNLKVVNLYIDNGREYLSNEIRDYCINKGISYHLTVPYTPQLNGVSERISYHSL